VLRSEPGHEAGGATSTDVAEGGAPPAADLATGAGLAAPHGGS